MELTKHNAFNDDAVKYHLLYLLCRISNAILIVHDKNYPVKERRLLRDLKGEVMKEITTLEKKSAPEILRHIDTLLHEEHFKKRDSQLASLRLPTFSSIVPEILFHGRQVPSFHSLESPSNLYIHTKKSG